MISKTIIVSIWFIMAIYTLVKGQRIAFWGTLTIGNIWLVSLLNN